MKKLVYITTNITNSGGMAKLLSVKLSYLASEYGYDISVINTGGQSQETFFKFDKSIHFYHLGHTGLNVFKLWRYRNQLKALITRLKPDIIVNCDNGLKGSLLPLLIGRSVTLIYENHSSKGAPARSLGQRLKTKASFLLIGLTAKSYYRIVVYPHHIEFWNPRNVIGVANPLLIEKPEQGAILNSNTALAVGRFSYQKNYEAMIKIWSLVHQNHREWELHIYGEGDKSGLTAQVRNLGLTESIKFFEPQPDLISVYQNASMILNTSRYEPFGLALIEGMAHGLPAIAFWKALGPRSYISDGVNGYLIKNDNLAQFAEKIGSLIENTDKLKQLSENARISVDDYSLPTTMTHWHNLFQSV